MMTGWMGERRGWLVLTLVLAVGVGACDDDEGPTEVAPTETIVELAAGNGDLETLVAAVEAAGLVDALSAEGPLTVFAPIDEAFAALDAAAVERLLADDNRALLQKVLTYHVVAGEVRSTDLMDGAVVETVEGSTVRITLDDGPAVNGAGIIAADIGVDNGVVHLIDGVLLDHLDLMDVAELNGFDALAGAVRAAGLESALRDEAASLTVFAPTDAAFDAIGPVPSDPAVLQPILLYHVLGAEAYASDLADGLALTTLEGGTLTVRLGEGATLDGARNSAAVTATDVVARNGVIHVIDSVLLPPQE